MVTLTVHNLPDEVYRALRVRANLHGRSTEAEVRAIFKETALPEGRVLLASILTTVDRRAKLANEEFANILKRYTTPARPIDFE